MRGFLILKLVTRTGIEMNFSNFVTLQDVEETA